MANALPSEVICRFSLAYSILTRSSRKIERFLDQNYKIIAAVREEMLMKIKILKNIDEKKGPRRAR
jgi:hypothetical protein